MQRAEGSAAHAGSLAGAQRNLSGHVLTPALTEFPRTGDTFGDIGRTLAGRAQHRAQLIVDRIGQHRPERFVCASELGHLSFESAQIGLGNTIDRTQIQFGSQIHQQLITP